MYYNYDAWYVIGSVVCRTGAVNSVVSGNIDVVVGDKHATWVDNVSAVFHYQVN